MMLPQKAAFTYLSLNRPRQRFLIVKNGRWNFLGKTMTKVVVCGRNVEGMWKELSK